VKEARQEAERAERLRLYYVAMTRAKERLIVSGSVELRFGARGADGRSPGLLDRLAADDELAQAGEVPIELVRGDARLLVRLDRYGRSRAGCGARAQGGRAARPVRSARGGGFAAAAPSSRRSSRC
jgi:hypothetical protein